VTCSGLEDDYLNNISQMKSNASALDLVQDKAGRSTFSAMRDAGLRRSEALIANLNAQWGAVQPIQRCERVQLFCCHEQSCKTVPLSRRW
jgi:hypothetical protein